MLTACRERVVPLPLYSTASQAPGAGGALEHRWEEDYGVVLHEKLSWWTSEVQRKVFAKCRVLQA